MNPKWLHVIWFMPLLCVSIFIIMEPSRIFLILMPVTAFLALTPYRMRKITAYLGVCLGLGAVFGGAAIGLLIKFIISVLTIDN